MKKRRIVGIVSVIAFLCFTIAVPIVHTRPVAIYSGPIATWSFQRTVQPHVCQPQQTDGFTIMLSHTYMKYMCGALIQVDGPSGSTRAIAVDECSFCEPDEVSLSLAAFAQIAPLEQRIPLSRVPVEWYSP